MFKVSKLNPNDNTLDEIHAIQKKISHQIKGLAPEKEVEFYNKPSKEFAKKFKANFIITKLIGDPGFQRRSTRICFISLARARCISSLSHLLGSPPAL